MEQRGSDCHGPRHIVHVVIYCNSLDVVKFIPCNLTVNAEYRRVQTGFLIFVSIRNFTNNKETSI